MATIHRFQQDIITIGGCAMVNLDDQADDDLHYLTVVTLSLADVPRLRDLLLQTMTEQQKLIAASTDEAAYCVAIDFFAI